MNKRCTVCRETKVLEEFYVSPGGRLGRMARCKKCIASEWKEKYPAKRKALLAYQKKYHASHRKQRSDYQKTYHAANRETQLANFKAYYVATKETQLAKNKVRYAAKKSTILAQQKTYYALNKKEILQQNKQYREDNKEARRAQQKKYYTENKASFLARAKKQRATKKENLATWYKEYLKTPTGRALRKVASHKRHSRAQFVFDTPATKFDFLPWVRDGAVCYLTGVHLPPEAVTVDHVVPLHWGGTSDLFNLLPVSRSPNSAKQESIVYFDIVTKEARFTLDPCPGGPTWPRIPLTQPSLDQMQAMVDAWKARRTT